MYHDENGRDHYWSVMYVGKPATGDIEGSYIWKLRDEFGKALEVENLFDMAEHIEKNSEEIKHPCIWKISHGSGNNGLTDPAKADALLRRITVVHETTKAKGVSKTSQGDYYTKGIKKGDYFYLCFGAEVKLFGQFDTDALNENQNMGEGWLERHYRIIAEAKTSVQYTGESKWWSPNNNSTCVPVPRKDWSRFEQLILIPYFGLKTENIINEKEKVHYWWLNANPKIWSFSSCAIG